MRLKSAPGLALPSSRSLLSLFVAVLHLNLAACGDEELAEPVVEVTPAPTPAPPPPPPEPGRLYYLVLDEVVKAPPGPAWSPLHRNLALAPLSRPSPEQLRDDGASEEVAGVLADWLAGRAASAEQLLLVQWSMSWGSQREAGTARQWGVCSLPCTLKDRFHAGKKRHPADPLEDALTLFAARAANRDLKVTLDDGVLLVHVGDEPLLQADGESRRSESGSKWKIARAAADGTLSPARAVPHGRSLRVVTWSVEDLPIEERSEATADTARLYPDLSESEVEVPPRVRGVEGLPQEWAWEEAGKFEGQFGIRPLPSEEGLTVERAEKLVRWVPTARQAGEGSASFALYSVSRGDVTAVFKPFPRGAQVYGATLGELEGTSTRLRVAGMATDVGIARAHEVLAAFSRFQGIMALPEGLPEEVLVYLSTQPVGVLDGGAGAAAFSLVVDERRGEEASLARAWARLLLGGNVTARGAVVADWTRWVEAGLLGSADRSLWTSTFASSGDDVLEVWSQRMRNKEYGGNPEPEEFLSWAAAKIPALGRELHKKLPARAWLLADGFVSVPEPSDGGRGASLKASSAPYGAAVALRLPTGPIAEGARVELSLNPGDGASFEWSSQWLSEEEWMAARGDGEQRLKLLEGWKDYQKVKSEPVPLTPPDGLEEGGAVLALFLRSQANWSARVQLRVVSSQD